MGNFAKRILARLGIWRSEALETVPPELAACEYDCVKTDCDDEHFETCARRLHTAEVLKAEAASPMGGPMTGGEVPEACVAPVLAANSSAIGSSAAAPASPSATPAGR